jgi:tetratricopeptide (TPR) repeat protein
VKQINKKIVAALLVAVGLAATPVIAQESEVQQYSDAGQKALASGNYGEAERAYEKLRDLEPGIAEVHANLGLIYFEEDKYEQAIPELQRALKLKPSLTKTGAVLAMAIAEAGRSQEALPGLEKCFRVSSDREMKRMCGLQLERAYTHLQRNNQAVEIALQLNRLYPDDPEVLYHSGKIFGNLAFLTMQRLSQVAPGSIWQHQTLAEAYESQKSYEAALGEYRQVLSIDPRRPGIHYRIGRTLLARGLDTSSSDDRTAAMKEFEEELAIDPLNANAAYELGEMHRNSGELDEALHYFEQALQHYPQFEEAQLGLAAVLMSLHKPEQALAHLQKAIALNGDNEVSWYRLSRVEGTLGNSAEQRKAMEKFQQLHSEKLKRQQAKNQMVPVEEVTPQKLDVNSSN